MAPHMNILPIFTILVATLISFRSSLAKECGIATYWGTNEGEPSLEEVCASGHYKYVNIAFLSTFGQDTTPQLNLVHCSTDDGTCSKYASQIKSCQDKHKVKVLLSIGGPGTSYTLDSTSYVIEFSKYLWNYFLGGSPTNDDPRPFGRAKLDGIDFYITQGNKVNYAKLIQRLNNFRSVEYPVALSAAPGCVYPDPHLSRAIQTNYFDYIWVRAYNDQSCDNSQGTEAVKKTWKLWSENAPGRAQLFLGLPASTMVRYSGYVTKDSLIGDILPEMKKDTRTGGLMLWNAFYDATANYGGSVLPDLCPSYTSRRIKDILLDFYYSK